MVRNLGDRIALLIEHRRAFSFCVGFVAGCYVTVAAAWARSWFL